VMGAALGQLGLDQRSRSHGDGRLGDEDVLAFVRREIVDGLPDAGKVGVARVGRRRIDADEDELACFVGVGGIGGELDPLPIGGDKLGQSRLVYGDSALTEQADPIGVEVHRDDVVA
jgi:hypothetical protein